MEGTGYLNSCRYLLHDRDTKFCREFRETLAAGGVKCLALPARNPNLNAAYESFMRTLEQEEIYCRQDGDLEDLSAHLAEFLENYYNRQRLHSALGYQTPQEFESAAATVAGLAAATMPYFTPSHSRTSAPAEHPACRL